MESTFMDSLLRKHPIISLFYEGVFFSDNLPPLQSKKIYLLNTLKQNELNSCGHWILISCDVVKTRSICFCCSFKTNIKSLPFVYKHVKDVQRRVYSFPMRIQVSYLSCCGPITLFVAMHLVSRITPRAIFNKYFKGRDLFKSNIMLCAVVKAHFKLKSSLPSLLYDKEFVLQQEKENKANGS